MSDSVDARLVGLGFLLGVQLRSQGLVTNAVSRKYRQRNWSPATWSQQVSVNPAVSNGRCAHWWKFIYTFEWSNPQDLMHNFVGRHWLGASVCLCVCYLYLFRSIYLATLSSFQFPAVSWQKKSKDCNNLYIQQFTASLSTVSIKVELKMHMEMHET